MQNNKMCIKSIKCVGRSHSVRSAPIGSTQVARNAGMQVASMAKVTVSMAPTGVQWLSSQLFQTAPHEPVVLAISILTLMLAALLACLAPAWRAGRTDPNEALRAE